MKTNDKKNKVQPDLETSRCYENEVLKNCKSR